MPNPSKAALGVRWTVLDAVKVRLAEGGYGATLVGFGTFIIGKRAARNGRIPTGKTIKIAAASLPKLRAGKSLKEAVQE